MKLLHCADVHLDSPLRGLARYEGAPADDIRGATRRAFENVVALAIEEAVECVVIAGDLYDGNRDDFNTAMFFQRQLHRLDEAGVRVVLVYGNHDAENAITKRLALPPNTHGLPSSHPGTVVLEDSGLALHGRSYATRAVTDNLTVDYPSPVPGLLNIGVLHTSLDGRPGHDAYAPCSLDDLAHHGYGYWALGHVHQREVMERDGAHIVFPGNIQGRNARETGPKGVTLVTYDGSHIDQIEERVIDVVRWLRADIDASTLGHADDLVGLVLETVGKSVSQIDDRLCAVRVTVHGNSVVYDDLVRGYDQWQAQLRADAAGISDNVWIEKVEMRLAPATSPVDDEAVDEARRAIGEAITAIDGDEDALAHLERSIEPLRAKFGRDLTEFGELTGITLDRNGIRALLPEIAALLVASLHGDVD